MLVRHRRLHTEGPQGYLKERLHITGLEGQDQTQAVYLGPHLAWLVHLSLPGSITPSLRVEGDPVLLTEAGILAGGLKPAAES